MKRMMQQQWWRNLSLDRRRFIKSVAAVTGACAAPIFLKRGAGAMTYSANTSRAVANRVYMVKNGTFTENINKLWDMLGGPESVISPSDVVVIKANAQWPNQGYTHTGCIKAVIDRILAIPGFSGEVIICDNVQEYGSAGQLGFDATVSYRNHNWPDHNWNSLAAEYQAAMQPVTTHSWQNSTDVISGPSDGEGWMREFFSFHGWDTYYSYPIFQSSWTGRMIDMKYGVWNAGSYTGDSVKTIVMPTLNNHGWGSEDYAGITSAVKSFIGATENHGGTSGSFMGHENWHRTSFGRSQAEYAGEMTARFIQQMYAPILYITPAIWSGHESRTGNAVETNTVLACENPATLDFIACRDVISPYAAYLDPTLTNNTRRQITGCINGGIGSIDPGVMSLSVFDFGAPDVPSMTLTGIFAALGLVGLEMIRSGKRLEKNERRF